MNMGTRFVRTLIGSVMTASIAPFFAMSPALAGVVASASFETPLLNSPGIQYGPDEFSYNTNESGPVVIANFAFHGFSGIYENGSLGVFPNATSGTQAAFLQYYNGVGSEIDWTVSGLTPGETYTLAFDDVSALVVPAENFAVSVFGAAPIPFVPGGAYTTHMLTFTPLTSSGTIDFVGAAGLTSNQASAIDNLTISDVPEPSTVMVLSFGLLSLLGLGLMRRRSDA